MTTPNRVRTQVTPLQRLLLEHMEATGESFNAIAKRAGMPRQTVQAVLYRQGASVPQEATMQKLAKGLGLPVAVIHQAAAQGLAAAAQGATPTLRTLGQEPTLLALMAEASELDDAQRQVLVATAKAMREGVATRHQPSRGARTSRKG